MASASDSLDRRPAEQVRTGPQPLARDGFDVLDEDAVDRIGLMASDLWQTASPAGLARKLDDAANEAQEPAVQRHAVGEG